MTVLEERLPRWFEAIELAPGSGRFSAVHAAAESVGSSLAPRTAFALVEYAMGFPSLAAFDAVAAAVSAYDHTFRAAAADLEPRLVATAALARALEGDDVSAAVVAGAVRSAEFSGLRSPVEELPALARAAQLRRFRSLRGRSRTTPGERRFAPPAAETNASELALLEERLQTRLDAANEELDVLWWAFGAEQRAEPTAWGGFGGRRDPELGAGETLLRAARELADCHRFHGELPTAGRLLRRVLGTLADEEYSLTEIAAAGAGELGVEATRSGPLLPIITAVATYDGVADEQLFSFEAAQSWIEHTRGDGVDSTIRYRGEDIATQALRELLLVGVLGDG